MILPLYSQACQTLLFSLQCAAAAPSSARLTAARAPQGVHTCPTELETASALYPVAMSDLHVYTIQATCAARIDEERRGAAAGAAQARHPPSRM